MTCMGYWGQAPSPRVRGGSRCWSRCHRRRSAAEATSRGRAPQVVVEAAASLPKRDRHSTCDTYARVCLLAPAAAAAAGDEDDEADEGDAGRAPRAVVAEGRTAVSCGRDGGWGVQGMAQARRACRGEHGTRARGPLRRVSGPALAGRRRATPPGGACCWRTIVFFSQPFSHFSLRPLTLNPKPPVSSKFAIYINPQPQI